MEVLTYECLNCCLNQIVQVTDMLGYDRPAKEQVVRECLAFLSAADYSRSTPVLMGGLWQVLVRHGKTEDPYAAIKAHCNREAEKLIPMAKKAMGQADNPFELALKYAIAGNLIDFAMADCVQTAQQNREIMRLVRSPFTIDHSPALRNALQQAGTLLYICDNAGEIVFDRLLVETLRQLFPGLSITCSLRGKPVLNDATMEDALSVGLGEVADLTHSGDIAAGTDLQGVCPDFFERFWQADVIIAKGQGNFESLMGVKKERLFYLFTAKCKPVADALQIPRKSIVCLQNKSL